MFFCTCCAVIVQESQVSILEELRVLREESSAIKKKVELMEKNMRFMSFIDPWGSLSSQTSNSNRVSLRDALFRRYKCEKGGAKCLVTDVVDLDSGDERDRVVAAHLFPQCRESEFFTWQKSRKETICSSIDHAPNGMFLLKDIEVAYDQQKICFLCCAIDLSIQLKVLDPELRQLFPTRCSKTFQELEEAVIRQPKITFKKRPSFRILSNHARFALDHAEQKGWLSAAERSGLDTIVQLCSPHKQL